MQERSQDCCDRLHSSSSLGGDWLGRNSGGRGCEHAIEASEVRFGRSGGSPDNSTLTIEQDHRGIGLDVQRLLQGATVVGIGYEYGVTDI